MKKTFLAALLAAASLSAAAEGLTAFTTYDYDRTATGSWAADHTAKVGVKLATSLGSFDVAGVGAQHVTTFRDNSRGAEVGYSLGTKLLGVNVSGRVAYGQLDSAKYYSMGAEAGLPLNTTFGLFAGYRHTNGLDSDTPSAANRVTLGVDVNVTKELSARLGYARSTVQGKTTNGATSAVAYKF